MANDVTANPLVLDAASTSAIVDPRNLHIKGVRWVGAGAGNTAIIKNANGKVMYSLLASAANYSEETVLEVRCDGLIMHTLGGGVIYVYLRVVK